MANRPLDDQVAVGKWLRILAQTETPGWLKLPDLARGALTYKYRLDTGGEPRGDDKVGRRYQLGTRQNAGRHLHHWIRLLMVSDRANFASWPAALVEMMAPDMPMNPVRKRSRRLWSHDGPMSGWPGPVWVSAVFHF